jgi:predicted nucleic acid-binding Zn ribbon protein
MHMLEKRLQVLLDERRWRRLSAYAAERNRSVGAVVREALDRTIPASRDERRSAARRILSAPAMTVPGPEALRRELDELRGRHG